MIVKFQRTNIEGDQTLSRVQDRVAETLDALTSGPANDHQILRGVELRAASVTHVQHGLGRALLGWVIVRQRASASIWDEQDSCPSPRLLLDLATSADVEVDVMVF